MTSGCTLLVLDITVLSEGYARSYPGLGKKNPCATTGILDHSLQSGLI
jgi:hypothetical protein